MLYGCRGIAADCCCPIGTKNSGKYNEYSGSNHIYIQWVPPPHAPDIGPMIPVTLSLIICCKVELNRKTCTQYTTWNQPWPLL